MIRRSFGFVLLVLCTSGPIASASTQRDVESAAKQQKVAFILVTDQGAIGVEQARTMIQQTMKQVRGSVLLELDRSAAANAAYVAKLRLAGAPVPLILVAARNGALAGGLPAAQATPALLQSIVPSPKKAEILQALQSGKCVLITVSRKGMTSESKALATCAAACTQLGDKSAMVKIDMADPQETAFLTQLKVDSKATEPVTLAVNAQGQVTGSYAGTQDVASLVQAATRVVGGCCPSTVQGGSKGCAPAPSAKK